MKRGTRTWFRDGSIQFNHSSDWVTQAQTIHPTQQVQQLSKRRRSDTERPQFSRVPCREYQSHCDERWPHGRPWEASGRPCWHFPHTTESCLTWTAFNQLSTTSHNLPFLHPRITR